MKSGGLARALEEWTYRYQPEVRNGSRIYACEALDALLKTQTGGPRADETLRRLKAQLK